MLQADHTGNRADVDNMTGPLLAHHRQRGAHDVHDTVEVRRELLFDLGCGHGLEIPEQAIARIVDHDVDAPELLHRLLDGRFRLCFVDNV